MYITRERHTKTMPLIPAYVAAGQHKALRANQVKIESLERELSSRFERMLWGVCFAWVAGFACGLCCWWLR